MCYQTFKEWALKQGWLELDNRHFLLPNGELIYLSLDENDRLEAIRSKSQIWVKTDEVIATGGK